MSESAFAVHDVDAILDYGFDWSGWLSDNATVQSSQWSGPDGVTISHETIDGAITQARVTVTDKTLRGQILINNHVVANDGQEDDAVLKLYLRQTS